MHLNVLCVNYLVLGILAVDLLNFSSQWLKLQLDNMCSAQNLKAQKCTQLIKQSWPPSFSPMQKKKLKMMHEPYCKQLYYIYTLTRSSCLKTCDVNSNSILLGSAVMLCSIASIMHGSLCAVTEKENEIFYMKMCTISSVGPSE